MPIRTNLWRQRLARPILAAVLIMLPIGWTVTPDHSATSPAGEGVCQVTADKSVAPSTVVINQETGVTLTVRADCGRVQAPLHVVVVVDNSLGMGGPRMADMRRGVGAFVDALDLTQSRMGLIAFYSVPQVLSGLTGDAQALKDATERFFPRQGSNLALALRTAEAVLIGGRPAAGTPAGTAATFDEVLVVLSGSPNDGGAMEVLDEAKRLRDAGVIIVTIAAGGGADLMTLEAMASGATRFYVEGTSSRYPQLFQEVAGDLTVMRLLKGQVRESLRPELPYSFGSGVPAPRSLGTDLTWTYAVWPAGGITITYSVVCKQLGDFTAHNQSLVSLAFDRGPDQQFDFPNPPVRCVPPPTATPIPTITPVPPTTTATPTATLVPTVTPVPHPAFLPILLRDHCRLNARRADVVLVLDTSSSMIERVPAGDIKLELAQTAASEFLDALNLPSDQAGIVVFSRSASVLHPMSGNLGALQTALTLVFGQVDTGSRLDLGLDLARELLAPASSDPARVPVIVLLTDGLADADPARQAAAAARAKGITIYAVGLGADVDSALLQALAGSPDRYFASPDGADLVKIYLDIARATGCSR